MSTNTNTPTNQTEASIEIAEYFTTDTYSPYGVIKTVNRILADLGIDKELPGPMGYTYCKKGYIRTSDSANKVVQRDAAIEWTETYVQKLVVRLTKASEETEVVVEDQYVGFENE